MRDPRCLHRGRERNVGDARSRGPDRSPGRRLASCRTGAGLPVGVPCMIAPARTRSGYPEAAMAIARDLVAEAIETPNGLTWTAEIAIGMGEARPVLGRGDIGPV